MAIEAILIKLLPVAIQYAPNAAIWLVSAISRAIVGEKAKSFLKKKEQRKAYAAAIGRAIGQFAGEFPALVSSYFDEHFLRETMTDELALFLTRAQSPDPDRIADAYRKQFRTPPRTDVAAAAKRFLALAEDELKKEKVLNDLLNSRQIDESYEILRGIERARSLDLATTEVRLKREVGLVAVVDSDKIANAFRAASQELIAWPQTLEEGQWLERPELEQIVERIRAAESSLSLLLGAPGSGKSALLARLASEAATRGWHVLAIRADQLPEDLASLEALQRYCELPSGVVECIQALAKDQKVLLLIDQLDALSELIDLKTDRLSVLLRLIGVASGLPNVHIVSSCRTFERTYDKRLNAIEAEEILLELPPWTAVEQILQTRGLAAGAWPEHFREVLRAPQHLKLFLRHFTGTGEAQVFETYQAMLEHLWSRRLFDSAERKEASSLVHEVATEMAEREALFLPTAKFDRQRKGLDYAVSAGILQYDNTGRQISFTHQTLFDFARARAFIAKEESLSRYVLERQTSLFVRPKLWSALHYLRGADPATYRRELGAIWSSVGLRPHLKTLLIEFLGQQEQPDDFEIRLLRPVFADDEYAANALAAIVGRQAWFDAIAHDLLPDAMTTSPELARAAIDVLANAWPFARTRVLELVGDLWLRDQSTYNNAWFALRGLQQWDRDALSIAVRIVETGDINNMAVQDLSAVISMSASDLAPELVGAHLRKRAREAIDARRERAAPAKDGTTDQVVGELIRHRNEDPLRRIFEGNVEWYEISGIAEAAPKAYLEHAWPPIREAIEELSAESEPRATRYQSDHLLATNLEIDGVDAGSREYPLMDSFGYAVRECVKKDPVAFRAFVEANRSSNAMTVHRLIAIGLCELASQDSGYVLEYLLGDERRLQLENFRENERETKMLLRSLLPHLQQADRERVEAFILEADAFRDVAEGKEPKERHKLQKLNRLFRLRLLLQLPSATLTDRTRELIESEKHIFPMFSDERREVRTWRSTSPLSAEKMVRANDATITQFLEAFPDETGWGDHFKSHGGSIEASRAFAAFAKQEPRRGVSIIHTLDAATLQRPAAYAIRELTEKELPHSELFELVLDLDRKGFSGSEFRECAADALRERVHAGRKGQPDQIINLLERWLDESQIERENKDELSDEERPGKEEPSDSLLWGLGGAYTVPGGSYPILNALFFGLIAQVPIPSDRLIGILEKHLARSDRIEVWNALAHSALPRLHLCNQILAQAFLDHLFATYPGLLSKRSGLTLIAYALSWVSPEASRRWIESVRTTGWSRAHQAYGELLALRAVLVQEDAWAREQINQLLARRDSDLPEDASTVFGLVCAAANLWRDAINRTLLSTILCIGMDASDKNTASAALDWFRVNEGLRLTSDSRPILEALASGRALEIAGTGSYALDRIADLVEDDPDLIYRLARRLIDAYKANLGNFSTSAPLASETLLSIAITLQRLEEPHHTRGLGLFELLLKYNAYKVREVLMDIDRRPGRSTTVLAVRRRRKPKRQRDPRT